MNRKLQQVLGVLALLVVAVAKLTDSALHRDHPEPEAAAIAPEPAPKAQNPMTAADQAQNPSTADPSEQPEDGVQLRNRAVFFLPFVMGNGQQNDH